MKENMKGDDNTRSFAALMPGTFVSHYRVLEMIGVGGMGEVYLAEDTKLNRRVAIKLLPRGLADEPEFRARFAREAKSIASLSHPNIVTIHEVGEYRGRPFFVMEHVKGQSLKELIRNKTLTFVQIVNIAIQICDGMAEAHRVGLIHRDIKPSNILVDDTGRVRILDFGLSRVVGESELTRTPSLMGTIGYLSPEQVKGEELSPASDLFSFGVVLYQMLTGSMPFTGEYEASVLFAIVNDTPPAVGSLRPDLPPQFEHILSKLLEKDPKNRFEDAADVAAALRAVLSGRKEHPSRGDSLAVKKRRRVLWPVAFLVLAIGLVLAWRFKVFSPSDSLSGRKMLAVLPFENLGPSEDEYFADGITDAVTTDLASYSDLGVVSRTSAVLYKDSKKSLREIGADLGVDYVLTGTVLWEKSPDVHRVRINTALLRVADDLHIWGHSYERVLDKIFAIQSEIAHNVARSLHVSVVETKDRRLVGSPTDNLEAYDFYLRGNEYFNKSWDQNDIQFAIQMYERAVDLDPSFAAAYAMLSRGQASMYWEYYDRSDKRRRLAKQAVEKSLNLQPTLELGHLALGYYYYHCELDYERALQEFTLALESQPNNADLYNAIGAVQRRQGRLESAVQNFQKALELDPRSYLKAFDVALTYGLMREYTKTAEYLDRAILLAPDWSLPYIYKAWLHILWTGDVSAARAVLLEASIRVDLTISKYFWWMARIVEQNYEEVLKKTQIGTDTVGYQLHCAQMSRLMGHNEVEHAYADSARIVLEQQVQQRPEDARLHSRLGLAYAGLRQKEQAIYHGKTAVELLPTSSEAFDAPFLVLNLAEIFVIFNEYDAAIDQLAYLISIPGFVSPAYLQLDPLWIPLHNHPRFQRLLADGI